MSIGESEKQATASGAPRSTARVHPAAPRSADRSPDRYPAISATPSTTPSVELDELDELDDLVDFGGAEPVTGSGTTIALALSVKCVDHVLERGTADIGASEFAKAAGVSARTFHRYLGDAHDCVRPFLRAGVDIVADELRRRPADEALGASLVAAFEIAVTFPLFEKTVALIPLLMASSESKLVWAKSVRDGETALAEPFAERLGVSTTFPRAVVLATVAAALIRRALETAVATGGDPVEILRAHVAALDGGPLARTVKRH